MAFQPQGGFGSMSFGGAFGGGGAPAAAAAPAGMAASGAGSARRKKKGKSGGALGKSKRAAEVQMATGGGGGAGSRSRQRRPGISGASPFLLGSGPGGAFSRAAGASPMAVATVKRAGGGATKAKAKAKTAKKKPAKATTTAKGKKASKQKVEGRVSSGGMAVEYVKDALKKESRSKGKKKAKGGAGGAGAVPAAVTLHTLQPAAMAVLQAVMGSRYNPAERSMTLSNLFADPGLAEAGSTIPRSFANVSLCESILSIIQTAAPDIVTLDLSNNAIRTLQPLRKLGNVARLLENLSLAGNELKSHGELKHLRSTASSLHRLILNGNPFVAKLTDRSQYESVTKKVFPQLLELDQLPVSAAAGKEQAAAAAAAALPPPQPAFFPADPELQGLVAGFLEKFFGTYDSARASLQMAYAPDCRFSQTCSIDGGTCMPKIYKAQNRNIKLKAVKDAAKRQQLLLVGPAQVLGFLHTLPVTQHDPISTFEIELWRSDAQMLCFNVAGQFQEESKGKAVRRHFHRVFILAPAMPGSEALAAGVYYQSVNRTAQDKAAAAAAAGGDAAGGALTEAAMQEMLQRFMAGSGMTQAYALECLQGNNWDFDRAVFDFHELKGKNMLPPEAFAQ